MGSIMIVVMLEATRRSVGWPLPIIAVVLILYALYGRSFPGIFAHPGNNWKSIVNHLYLTSQGIFGVALGVVATYVFHYVLFGVLATRVGLGRFFIDIATALTGRFAGGPAKVSIFGSALFGMISGSSIANTVTVGSLTIPAMIRIGYSRHFAGAVEAAAATGGQITPPIMGAAAFLMVEYLAVPYQTIILAAIVPAFMHFFGVFCQIHFEAKKHGLRGLPRAELPVVSDIVRRDWPTAMPLIVLLIVLFSGFTPYLAAFWGITGCIVIGLTNRNPVVTVAFLAAIALCVRLEILTEWIGLIPIFAASIAASAWYVLKDDAGKLRFFDIIDAFVVGAKYAISVGAAAATVGVIIGIVTLTGVGFKLSSIITGAAADFASLFGGLLPYSIFDVKAMTLFFTLGDDGHRLRAARLRHPHDGQLSHHGHDRRAGARHAGRAAARVALLRVLLRRAGGHHATGRARRLCRRQHGGRRPFKTGNTAFRLGMAKALVPFVFVYSPAMLLVTKEFTWPAFFETDGGLHGRHRHARRRPDRLRARPSAQVGTAVARRHVDPRHLAEPHGDAARSRTGLADALAPDCGMARRAVRSGSNMMRASQLEPARLAPVTA